MGIGMREACERFDVSRPTLRAALKSGRVSGRQDARGHWSIEPSELVRVFQARPSLESGEGEFPPFSSEPEGDLPTLSTPPAELDERLNALETELAWERAARAAAEALLEERAQRIALLEAHTVDLRAILGAELRLLTAPRPEPERERPRWWDFMRRGTAPRGRR